MCCATTWYAQRVRTPEPFATSRVTVRYAGLKHWSRRLHRMSSFLPLPRQSLRSGGDRTAAGQVLLNISLRDLPRELFSAQTTYSTTWTTASKAETSPHLAERLNRLMGFRHRHDRQLLAGDVALDADRPTIVSPFGLGVLDIAVGSFCAERGNKARRRDRYPGLFGEASDW